MLWLLSIEEQKCEHVANNDVEWVVDSTAFHHVFLTKWLFTTYKAGDFGTMKMSNSSYSKIVKIGDVCIETNVGSTVMLKDVRHVLDLRMNVFSTLAMDRADLVMENGNLLRGHWLLQEDVHVAICTRLM